jgi:hypothetical protein
VNDYLDADIRVLISPSHPTRLALLLAYRQGLRTSPAAAWNLALDIARERFPASTTNSFGACSFSLLACTERRTTSSECGMATLPICQTTCLS